jgi:hypothetical protein
MPRLTLEIAARELLGKTKAQRKQRPQRPQPPLPHLKCLEQPMPLDIRPPGKWPWKRKGKATA